MINRRSFFSKFSLLAFFVPFVPKLKSFLYDKNLEYKPILPKNCQIMNCAVYSPLANHPCKVGFWATYYKNISSHELRIYWEDKYSSYDEIFSNSKHKKIILHNKPKFC